MSLRIDDKDFTDYLAKEPEYYMPSLHIFLLATEDEGQKLERLLTEYHTGMNVKVEHKGRTRRYKITDIDQKWKDRKTVFRATIFLRKLAS